MTGAKPALPRPYLYARIAAAVVFVLLVLVTVWGYGSGPWWAFLMGVSALPLALACAVFLRPPSRRFRRR